ncbi:MAG: hypothetical protein LAT84_09210 [Balneolia bacterium]|nr:hypothetical protein [Balneolia bacterium]
MMIMVRHHIFLALFAITFFIAACGTPEPREARITNVTVEVRSEIIIPDAPEEPLYLSAVKRDDCTIALADVRTKLVYSLGVCEPEISVISGQGTEDHQYQFPFRLFDFDGLLGIADMDINEFIILGENDELYKLLAYDDQPGRSLSYSSGASHYYRTNSGIHLMSRVETESRSVENFFLLPEPFQVFSLVVPGGGIQRISDKIYAISSLMPYIYVYNETEEQVEYLLPDFMEFSLNTRRLPDIPFEEQNAFLTELREYQQYSNLLTIEYNGETHLLIFYNLLNEFHMAIVNTDGETVVNQPLDYYILGTFDDAIIGMDVETAQVFLLEIGS